MEVAKILTPTLESDQESQPSSEIFSQQKCETSSSPNSSPGDHFHTSHLNNNNNNDSFETNNNNNNLLTSGNQSSAHSNGSSNLMTPATGEINFCDFMASPFSQEPFRSWLSERSNSLVTDLVQQQLEKRLLQIESQNAQIHRHILDLTASLVRLEGFLENSGVLSSNGNSLKRKFHEDNNAQPTFNQNSQYRPEQNPQKNLGFLMDFIQGQSANYTQNLIMPNNNSMPYEMRNPLLNFINNNISNNKSRDFMNKKVDSQQQDGQHDSSTPLQADEDSKKRKIKEILSKFTAYLSENNQPQQPSSGQTNQTKSSENSSTSSNITTNFAGINQLLTSKLNQHHNNQRSEEMTLNKSKKWDDNRPYRNTTNQRQDEPVMILNPAEPREMFVGGVHPVRLPVWAYRKCLGMVRGAPHELGPRLCLRLLQSLFSLNYLVTHNYNGSGGKTPIDPTVMSAVLQQAQLQFGSDHFFTEPMALGKLRDYLNNAFRVMAFRQRKGERVRSPFWNEDGEPVLPLDPPLGYNISGKNTCANNNATSHGTSMTLSSVIGEKRIA